MSKDMPMSDLSDAQFQEAQEIYTALLKALKISPKEIEKALLESLKNSTSDAADSTKKSEGVTEDVTNVTGQNLIPLTEIEPLPDYVAEDLRSGEFLTLMKRFHLTLMVVNGLRGVLQEESPKKKQPILVRLANARLRAYITAAKRLVLPRAFLQVWKGNREILDDLSQFLRHCVYDSEEGLAKEAALYAAERHAGVIFFLAIFPNIPLIIPTLEVRLLVTKPLLGIARTAHAIFGNFFLIGYFLNLIVLFARLFDLIPRMQVRVVQNLTSDRWVNDEQKHVDLIRRYLKAVEARIEKPRLDAIRRGLLSIVS